MVSADFLREALDSSPDAIVISDAAGSIIFASARVNRLLGYDAAELVGQSIESLLPERFRARHLGHRARYGAQPVARPMGTDLELTALRKDGTEVPVEISLSPLGAGLGLTTAALRDATDRRRARRELIEAREAAVRANEAKSRFLATASHDLRQPLQTLTLLNGALRRMIDDATIVEALTQQDQAIGAMARLLNALLDIGKLESGAVRPQIADFSAQPLFDEMRREFLPLATSKGLELRIVTTAACVRSDRALVGQILRNLVSNAVKYTLRGWVELRCVAGPHSVVIAVQDSGIGIPADQLTHIYEEFYQAGVDHWVSREGYGLGLSIVHRLVALLGLRISVESEPGRGSTFTLELPRGTSAGETAGAAPVSAGARQAAATDPLVLLVDDDAGVRAATSMLLKVSGYRVVPAASLADAVVHARSNPALALIMADYHLGGGETGADVITAVRVALARQLPAILITGDTSSAVGTSRPEERMYRVSKPIDAEQLLALAKSLITAP